MKKILFRGQCNENRRWVYGDLMQQDDRCYIISWDGQYWSKDLVIPETVGQYIGREDKNGITIFEGDIIKHKYKAWDESRTQKYVVEYVPGLGAFIGTTKSYDWCDFDKCSDELEIVGNIFDGEYEDVKWEELKDE